MFKKKKKLKRTNASSHADHTMEERICEKDRGSDSATVSVAMLRIGYAEVVFIQPGGKLGTM